MKWLRFTNLIIVFIATLAFSITSNAIASDKNKYAAVIYLPDEDTAKWLVYSTYLNIAKIDNKIDKLFKLTTLALDATQSPSDLYNLESKFQQRKQDLDQALNMTQSLSAFNNDRIIIKINDDGYGQHFLFDLPRMNIQDLGLQFDDLTTADNAQNAIIHVKAAINRMNALLPSSSEENSLNKFSDPRGISHDKLNKFYIASADDSKAIIESLVSLNKLLTSKLDNMLDLASQATSGKHTPAETAYFDIEFQADKQELNRMLASSCQFGNIKMFNDNKLKFKVDGQVREYQFTKLDLNILNIKNDSILDSSAATSTFNHLQLIRAWLTNWIVSGTAPFIGK